MININENLIKSEIDPVLVSQVIQWHNSYIKRNNIKHLEGTIFDNPQFQFLCDNFTGTIGIVDYFSKTYLYINSRCKEMFGYSPDEFKMHGLNLVVQLIRKEHSSIFIQKMYAQLFEIFEEYAKTNETKNLKVTFTNQIKSKDGTFRWMLHQMTVLETNENGMPVLIIKMISDIHEIKKDKALDFIVNKKNNKGIYETILKKTYLPEGDEPFAMTQREREILQLVSQGLSARQIANNLFISEHTVYTHKKNMLKKFQLNSSNELVKYASSQGLIS